MRATHAWTVLVAAVATYELLCHPEHLLTAGADRARARHPVADVAVRVAIVSTAAHLVGYRGPFDAFRLLGAARALTYRKEIA